MLRVYLHLICSGTIRNLDCLKIGHSLNQDSVQTLPTFNMIPLPMVNKKYWCTIICSIMQARICGELQNSSYLVHNEVAGSSIYTAWYRWTKNWRLKTLDKIISTMGYNMSRTRWCCLLDFHYHLQLRQQDKVSSLQPLLGIHSRWYYISCWFHVSKLMWIDIRYIICSQLFTQIFIYIYTIHIETVLQHRDF